MEGPMASTEGTAKESSGSGGPAQGGGERHGRRRLLRGIRGWELGGGEKRRGDVTGFWGGMGLGFKKVAGAHELS